MKSKDKLIAYINEQESVKRIKQLESLIDSNEEIKALLEEKKKVSQAMLLSKKIELDNTYSFNQKRYNEIDERLKNIVFVEEYMNLLDDAHNDLEIMISYIESKINKALNEK